MATIVAGMASSHAYTFISPAEWDVRRERSREGYERRNGKPAPVQPQIENETTEANLARYAETIGGGLRELKESLEELNPDVLILIGDDQHENYQAHIPQLAIYTGQRVVSVDRESQTSLELPCDAEIAMHILNTSVEAGFDVTSSNAYPDDELRSHAHAQVLNFLQPTMPIVPVFVNSINIPAPNPDRCYAFGQCIGKAIETFGEPRRVVLYASGGLSHFSQGFPYKHYSGPYTLGAISEQFDRRLVEWMRAGQGAEMQTLTSSELLYHGDIELRVWITLLGVLGERKPEWLRYEPFYRGIMGMAVGYWRGN
jgi:aromatic ring-opening dioxygenase LigB subunit